MALTMNSPIQWRLEAGGTFLHAYKQSGLQQMAYLLVDSHESYLTNFIISIHISVLFFT